MRCIHLEGDYEKGEEVYGARTYSPFMRKYLIHAFLSFTFVKLGLAGALQFMADRNYLWFHKLKKMRK